MFLVPLTCMLFCVILQLKGLEVGILTLLGMQLGQWGRYLLEAGLGILSLGFMAAAVRASIRRIDFSEYSGSEAEYEHSNTV